MATRAVIGKLERDGSGIKAIYLHSDGYLEHAGIILDEHYRDENKVDELIAHGDVSSLNENIGVKLDFNDLKSFYENKQCRFYGRDRGEQHTHFDLLDSEIDLIKFAKRSCDAEYVYLYAYGYWYVYTIEDNTYEFVELEDEIAVIGIK
jgi:hypothetical protein